MRPRRSWVPNLVTSGNLFCGFLAIVFAVQGEFRYGAMMICLAACFDTLDGRAARMLKVAGDFGKQLDSLADVVSFGVAPALLVYQHSLHQAGWIGTVAAGIFVCCGAGRLARYNITADPGVRTRYFTGMPIPMAGLLAASIALYQGEINVALVIAAMLTAAAVMISTLRYPVLEIVAFESPLPVRIGFLIIFVISLARPGEWLFMLPISYMIYGILTNIVEALMPKAKEA